jgi:hypothetical protein
MLLRVLYYVQKMAKNIFIFLLFFTLAKVWQEFGTDFSEKPINWSDFPKLLCCQLPVL